ncbi:hypothetical protein [Staphylococcus gallinarum]|uniref:hypothetical protein n=1 Tax=Staphylococcus gallinarum TaxID=1293 RepID=UPI0030BF5EB2
MKTVLSIVLCIIGTLSILFSFVGISTLFDPTKHDKMIDIIMIIFFMGFGLCFIILGGIIFYSQRAKKKAIRLNIEANLINENKQAPKIDKTENESINTKSNNPYEMKF